MMETSNPDPGGWVHIFCGALLAAAAKWCWERLSKTQRPARTEHSNAYVAQQVEQLRQSVDGVSGTVEGHEDRIRRLEQERRPRHASATD